VYWEAEKSNEREREKKKIAAVERQQLTKLMELTKESLEDVVEELEELKRWRETVREKNYKDFVEKAAFDDNNNDNNNNNRSSRTDESSNNATIQTTTTKKGSWLTRKGG
jgi:hypothetical protein